MLTILWGRATASHASVLLADMVRNAKAGVRRQILLVPEPFSHESERLLCELGGDSISLSCEVLTFKRLAHRVLTKEGGLAAPQLDEAGRLLLLSRALTLVRGTLSPWGRVAAEPQFLQQLLSTLDELKLHEASAEQLTNLPPEHTSADKLQDISLIWRAFDALTAQVALDPRDLLSRIADLLDTSDYAKETYLYIDGFVSFTAQEYRVLRGFLRYAVQVTAGLVGVPLSPEDSEPHWEQPRLAAARLTRMAESVNCPVEVSVLPENLSRPESLRHIERYLWKDTLPADPVAQGVTLCEASDLLTECDWAAGLVRQWVEQDGLRYREIAIAAPQWETYRSILEATCKRHQLPLFADNTTPLPQKAAVRFISAALEAVLHGFEAENMVCLLKTGLTPLTPDQTFWLEDYLYTHNIRNFHWTKEAPWTAHPAGWGNHRFSPEDTARLSALNDMRVLLRTPLMALRSVYHGEREARVLAAALYQYCLTMELPHTLEAQCRRLEEQGLIQQADEGRQLWGLICRAFDNCVDITGSELMKPEVFAQLFSLCLSQYQVGVIPVALDRLHIGPVDRLRRRDLKRLILLGAAEPFMPRRSEASGLLTDEERILLEETGLSLAPGAEERASRELFTLYQCLALPCEQLAVSTPSRVEGGAVQPSLVFTRIAEITGAVPILIRPDISSVGMPWLSHREALSPPYTGQLLSESGALSASRIQTYQTCRFQYFARYGLGARKRAAPGPGANDAGTMIHAVLAFMVSQVNAAGGFQKVKRADALSLAAAGADAYLSALPGGELHTARITRLLSRLRQTALQVAANVYDELSCSDFTPLSTEYYFEASLSPDSLPLRGIIDRIDGWLQEDKLYLRVVDYKSGRSKFSLRDVWHGLGIQMLCYLFALEDRQWEGHPIQPAGVLYLPAHDRFLNAASRGLSEGMVTKALYSALKRDGLLLDNEEVINAMERGDDKVFLPVSYTKEGMSKLSKVTSAANLGLLHKHMGNIMGQLSKALREGAVDAFPLRQNANQCACDYCDFAKACLFDEQQEQYRILPAMSDAEVFASLQGDES